MIQSTLNDFVCLKHKKKINSVCLNQLCQQSKLICFDCLINAEHNSHLEYLQDYNNFDQKLEQTKIKYNNLISQLNLMMDGVIKLFQSFKKGIDEKYNMSIQSLNVLSTDEFIQYIDNMISFDQYQDTVKNQFKQNCQEFEQKLNDCLMDLQLDTLSYNIVSQQNKEIAQYLYKKGYALYWEKSEYDKAIDFFDQALSYDRKHMNSLWCKGISLNQILHKLQE